MKATIELSTPEQPHLPPQLVKVQIEPDLRIDLLSGEVSGFLTHMDAEGNGLKSVAFTVQVTAEDVALLLQLLAARGSGLLIPGGSVTGVIRVDLGSGSVTGTQSLTGAAGSIQGDFTITADPSDLAQLLTLLLARGQGQAAFPAGVASVA